MGLEENTREEYLKILERLKFGMDRFRVDINEEFTTIKRDIDGRIKKHLLASLEIIRKLTVAAELRDEATGQHIKRIGMYCRLLAVEMDMPYEFIDTISYASPLHDIGKIGIPDSILLKEGSLTPGEFEQIKTHTMLGYEILKDSEYPIIQMAATIAHNHHERYNGTGYPLGLIGEKIPIESRIIILADQYDSLRSPRPYKAGMSHEKALDIIAFNGDDKTTPDMFDPEILKIFKRIHKKFDNIYEIHNDGANFFKG